MEHIMSIDYQQFVYDILKIKNIPVVKENQQNEKVLEKEFSERCSSFRDETTKERFNVFSENNAHELYSILEQIPGIQYKRLDQHTIMLTRSENLHENLFKMLCKTLYPITWKSHLTKCDVFLCVVYSRDMLTENVKNMLKIMNK